MKTPTHTFSPPLLVLCSAAICGAFLAPAAQGQALRGKTTASGTSPTSTTVTTSSDPGTPRNEQTISPRVSAAILAGIKYNPPPPPKPADDEEVDLREVDKPKNEIVRLPQYTVIGNKPVIFTDRTLYTQEQLKKLAASRYLSVFDKSILNRFTLPLFGKSNATRAMDIYLEDERLKNMSGAKQQISLLRDSGETDRADNAQQNYYEMFLRPQDTSEATPPTLLKQQGQ